MKRFLLMGVSPLPCDRSRRHAAPGLRTWQLCRALLEEGHAVRLVTLGERHPGPAGHPGLERVCLPEAAFSDGEALQELHDAFRPHAVLAASSYQPTLAACLLRSDLPFWIDLPGDLMAEAQLRAAAPEDARAVIQDFRGVLEGALRRGDHFSAVSGPQRHALVGQLGLAGRLHPAALGRELVSVLPPSVEPPSLAAQGAWTPPGVPGGGDRRLLILSGGLNTWCDVDTLVQGARGALEADARLHLVMAGGPVPHHSERVHRRLLQQINESGLQGRFHLAGWLWPEQLAGLYRAGTLALNLDLPCYEAELGSRNRLLDWLRHGLPCLTTPGCELARDLVREGLALAAPPEDPGELARLILEHTRDSERLHEIRRRAPAAVCERHSLQNTTAPLRAWARDPQRAADAGTDPAPPPSPGELAARLERLERQLRSIRQSRPFRGLQALQAAAEGLRRRLAPRRNP